MSSETAAFRCTAARGVDLTSYISYHHRLAIALLIWCSVAPYNDTVKNKITNKIK